MDDNATLPGLRVIPEAVAAGIFPTVDLKSLACYFCVRLMVDLLDEDEKRSELRAYFGPSVRYEDCTLICNDCWQAHRPPLYVVRTAGAGSMPR